MASDAVLMLDEGLPVVFVSVYDVVDWEGADDGFYSSVMQYRVKDAAQTLAKNNANLLVFYDPIVFWDIMNRDAETDSGLEDAASGEAIEEAAGEIGDEIDEAGGEISDFRKKHIKSERAAQAESERLLRAQAEAFLQWLRAGV
jgi:hypothetical protein